MKVGDTICYNRIGVKTAWRIEKILENGYLKVRNAGTDRVRTITRPEYYRLINPLRISREIEQEAHMDSETMQVVVFGREAIIDQAVYFIRNAEDLADAQKDANDILDGSGEIQIIARAEVHALPDGPYPTLVDFDTLRGYVG